MSPRIALRTGLTGKKVAGLIVGLAVFVAACAFVTNLDTMEQADFTTNSPIVDADAANGVKITVTTSFDENLDDYAVTGITLGGTPGAIPDEARVAVTLVGASGASLGEYTSSDGGVTWLTPASPVAASSVEGASLAIDGGLATSVPTRIS